MKLRSLLLVALVAPLVPLVALRAAQDTTDDNPHGDDSLDCGQCHTAEQWTPVVKPPGFHHETTGFALEGAHGQARCRDCHRTLVFSRVGTACADCHRDAHKGELGFACEACHASASWANQSRTRERHGRTRFPLTGVHANVDCESCHRGQRPNQYATTPTECGECHAQSYQSARNPNHVVGNFSRRCESCHLPTGWRPATGIDHSRTRFPLTGAHQVVTCARCHAAGRYAGTPTDCVSCHKADYDATSNPNHRAGRFPTQCQGCHSTSGWRPASNVDHSKTRFPLTGAHQAVECSRCHVGGRYAGTTTDCYSCHRTSYDATSSPNHRAAGFPTQCQSCHTTSAWRPASFDHNKTRFPLTGAHRPLDCGRCHPGGRYSGTPSDCYACHQSDYNATNNPNHRAAGFPTQCQSCHTTGAWRPASFDHDARYFPIYSGAHRGKWSSCNTCHVSPGNYRVFECTGCHEHDRSRMDGKHDEVGGYSYNSAACYRCHPRGTGDD